MSVESLALALNCPNVTAAERLVLIGIANHDGDGGAWPSVATLARYACVTTRSVQRTLAGLVERGLVTVEHNTGGTLNTPPDRRPNRYTLHFHRSVDNPVDRGDTSVTPSPNGVTPTSPRGVTPVSPEPSLEPSSTTGSRDCAKCDGTGWEYLEAANQVVRCDHAPHVAPQLELVT